MDATAGWTVRPPGLAGWAAGQGLDHLGSANASGYTSVLPGDPRRQFDVVRGTTARDRDVCLWLECDADGRPVTCAAAAVPEAAVLSAAPGGHSTAGDALLPQWPAGSAVNALREDRVRCTVAYGLLVLRQAGHAGPAAMDRLLGSLDDAAAELAAACAPLHRPIAFTTALPTVSWPVTEPAPDRPWPPTPLLEEVHRLGRRWEMRLEDPRAYHRAFPTVPVPGVAFAVLRGTLPRTGTTARLALHTEAALPGGSGRTALLLAAPGAVATAPGGVWLAGAPLPVRYAVRGGVLAVWLMRHRDRGLGDVDTLVTYGIGLARRLGVPLDASAAPRFPDRPGLP